MNNCYRLNLPSNPLNPKYKDEVLTLDQSPANWIKSPPWKIFHGEDEINRLILPEILQTFRELDLYPSHIVLFFLTTPISFEKGYLHRDIALSDGVWTDVPFGINFELNPTTKTTISWWDTSNLQEIYDDDDYSRNCLPYQNGRRYHANRLRSIPKYLNATLIETHSLEGNTHPILFRTNVAHSVSTTTSEGIRFNLSIRFDLKKHKTFEEGLEKLKPIIIGSSNTN